MKIKDEISGLMDDWHASAHRHRGVLGRGWELRFPAQNCNAPPTLLFLKYGSVPGALLLGQLYPPPLVLARASPPLGRGYPPPGRGGEGRGGKAVWLGSLLAPGMAPSRPWLLGASRPALVGSDLSDPGLRSPSSRSLCAPGLVRGLSMEQPPVPQQQLAPAVIKAFVAMLMPLSRMASERNARCTKGASCFAAPCSSRFPLSRLIRAVMDNAHRAVPAGARPGGAELGLAGRDGPWPRGGGCCPPCPLCRVGPLSRAAVTEAVPGCPLCWCRGCALTAN